MKQIILTASFSGVANEIENQIIESGNRQTVAFIDTASLVETVDFYVREALNWFKSRQIEIIHMDVLNDAREQLEMKLKQADIIYVSGGNTFYLLEQLRKKGVDSMIKNEIEAGKLYIGESAGSIILSPDIQYCAMMDDASVAPNLKSTEGLNQTDFYTLPHYGDEPFVDVAQAIWSKFNNTLNMRTLSNNQALLIGGDSVELLTFQG